MMFGLAENRAGAREIAATRRPQTQARSDTASARSWNVQENVSVAMRHNHEYVF
jgi:hypothetical protein